ncbi:MAG: cytochrome c-type biogenesis protein CcmH [Chloroflexota bacterium]|nr:cytochrome c-type biogenesis protein CcmH [Chloroflexota bacterium]
MRRLAVPIAAGALLALAAMVGLAILRPAPALTRAEQAAAIAADLKCPDCQSLSVAQSTTQASAAIRRQIGELLAAGRNPSEVRRYFVDRYGDWILLSPTSPLAWIVPFVAIVAGALLLATWLSVAGRQARTAALATTRGAADGPASVISEAARRRVRDEAEALDA